MERIRFLIIFREQTVNIQFRRKAMRSDRGVATGISIRIAMWSNAFSRNLSGFAGFPLVMTSEMTFFLPVSFLSVLSASDPEVPDSVQTCLFFFRPFFSPCRPDSLSCRICLFPVFHCLLFFSSARSFVCSSQGVDSPGMVQSSLFPPGNVRSSYLPSYLPFSYSE